MQTSVQRGILLPCSRSPTTLFKRRALRRKSVLGIDLGTSTSCVSVIEQGKPKLLQLFRDSTNFLSTVTYSQSSKPSFGNDSYHDEEASSFSSFKRLIGREFEDAHQDAKGLGYTPREGRDGALELYCPALDTWLTPTDVAADLLRSVVASARQQLDTVTGAVIGVPARFDDGQCQATLEAAHAAGLDAVHLLREPIAAALACNLQHEESGAILVFDLGGGTFDLSLLESFEGVLEVLATSGNTHLGGIDFDADIAKWVLQQQGYQEADISAQQWRMLLTESESAKRRAMTNGHADFQLAGFNGHGGAVRLSSEQLEVLMRPTLQRMWPSLQELGEDACLEWHRAPWDVALPSHHPSPTSSEVTDEQSMMLPSEGASDTRSTHQEQLMYTPEPRLIGQVVLVGGGTKASVIRSFVKDLTGIEAIKGIDPEAVVAIGCATYAGMLMDHTIFNQAMPDMDNSSMIARLKQFDTSTGMLGLAMVVDCGCSDCYLGDIPFIKEIWAMSQSDFCSPELRTPVTPSPSTFAASYRKVSPAGRHLLLSTMATRAASDSPLSSWQGTTLLKTTGEVVRAPDLVQGATVLALLRHFG
ncbi:hypothetical protein WJX74_007580 [Apatococcus lobatus]|uniref:Uncharacterized protein n=1 Tax=Apatococcus lobatus TaxID=904363 RepID=A0AAW1QDI9_9CHLO